jgi:hypothetical protein
MRKHLALRELADAVDQLLSGARCQASKCGGATSCQNEHAYLHATAIHYS